MKTESTERPKSVASRRAAVADPVDLSDHPLAGTWLAMVNPLLPDNPQFAAPSFFGADGSVVLIVPTCQLGPNGVRFVSAYVGTWEPHDEQTGHFTAVQTTSDAEGTYLGTTTVDGFPHVSDDGQTFINDGSLTTVTIRDPDGVVVATIPPGTPGRPVTATRMGPGVSGFPDATPVAGTTAG